MGSSFAGVDQNSYRIVHVDTNRVTCKCVALDTYLSILKSQVDSSQLSISEDRIEALVSFIVKICQDENDSLRTHGVCSFPSLSPIV